jgi:hypothetical protein
MVISATWNRRDMDLRYGKGKVVPVLLTEHHTMKVYWGSGGIAPCIDFGTRWR